MKDYDDDFFLDYTAYSYKDFGIDLKKYSRCYYFQ